MATPVRNIFGTHVPTEADLPRAQRWLKKMGVVDAAEMGLEIAILNVIEVWNTNKTAGSVALAEVLSEMARGGLISEKKAEPEKVDPAPIEEVAASMVAEAVAAWGLDRTEPAEEVLPEKAEPDLGANEPDAVAPEKATVPEVVERGFVGPVTVTSAEGHAVHEGLGCSPSIPPVSVKAPDEAVENAEATEDAQADLLPPGPPRRRGKGRKGKR